MDRLDALAAFVAIADLGGFAAAARHLRVSPQAVTRAVASLEARLGVQMFRRTTRSVRLTDAGADFLPRARQLLLDLRDAEQAVMGGGAEPHGMLSVTAPVVFGRLHVLPVVAELQERHARLDVRLLLLDRNVQLVEEGIDVAVRIGDLPDSALRAVKVGEVQRVLVAAPAYLDRHGEPGAPAELKDHATIAFTGLGSGGGTEWRFGSGSTRIIHVRPRLVLNDAAAAIAAAEAGLGIARVLSYQVRDAVADGRLCTLLDGARLPPVPVSLLFFANRGASPNVRAFVDLANERLRAALRQA